jgi:hypothetical protein
MENFMGEEDNKVYANYFCTDYFGLVIAEWHAI